MYNKNLRVHLIDTPGFDDTNRSDVQVLQDLAHWLSGSFKYGIRLSGVVFLHRISDPRMASSARRNLLMFKKLCGEKAYQSVILGTTHWSNVSPQDGTRRERELIETDEYWGLMCKKGSRVFRYANTRESALSLISYILKQHMTVTLDIQDEMVNKGHDIDETSAAHELNAEIIRERERHMAELTAMREQMEEAIKERDEELQQQFKEEIDTLQEKIQRGALEQQKLTETLKEVDKRKEAEFRAFKEQMKKERDQERQRYDAERQKHMAKVAQQEKALKEQQRRAMERMEKDKASLEEMARKQKEYRKAMEREREKDKRRLADIEKSHRKFKEALEAANRRLNDGE
jgi:DNA repair exonuclease SbcCD ATPase subunit